MCSKSPALLCPALGRTKTRYGHVAADYLVIQFRIRVVPIEVVNVLTVRSRLFWFLFLCEASRRAEMWLFELRMEVRSLATSLSFFLTAVTAEI